MRIIQNSNQKGNTLWMQHRPNKEWMWGIYLYNKHKQGYINWTCMTFSKGFIMGKTEWRTHSSHILLIHICNILHTFRYFSITLISFRIYNKYYLNRRGINYRVHTLKHVMWTSEDRQIHYQTKPVILLLNSCPGDPLLSTFWTSLFNTPDSKHQLIRKELTWGYVYTTTMYWTWKKVYCFQ